ncbi:dihydrofolate reductase, partial [Bacillus cereus]
DEYVVTITPHILGSGVPLFQDKNPEINLTLTDTKRFGQFVNLYYKVK